MSTHQELRTGMVPCPVGGRCREGNSHRADGPQLQKCLAAASRSQAGAGTSVGSALATPPSAAGGTASEKTWRDYRSQDLYGSVELPGDAGAVFSDGEYGEPMVFMESEDGFLAGLKHIEMGPYSHASNTGLAFDFDGQDEYDISRAAGDVYVDMDTDQIMIRPGLTHGAWDAPGDAMSLDEFAALPSAELHWLAGEEPGDETYRPAQLLRDFAATPQGEAFIRLHATRRRTPKAEESGTPEGKATVQSVLDEHRSAGALTGGSHPLACACGSVCRDEAAMGSHRRRKMAEAGVTPEGNPFPDAPLAVVPEVLAKREEAAKKLNERIGESRFRPVESLVMQAKAFGAREEADLVAGEEYASALEKRGYSFVQDSTGDTYLTANGWHHVVRAEVSPTGVEIRDEQYGEPLNKAREGAAMADYITNVERAYAVASARQWRVKSPA